MENRRTFMKMLFGVFGFGLAALKGGVAFAKKLGLQIDKVPSLGKVGGSAKVKLAGKEVLLIRTAASEVRGLCPKCTHQSCDVRYNPKTSKLDCTCHGSSFDLNGKVLKGPAAKDLKTYATSLKDGRIIISVD
jgi:Rieske Fe-S protein